MRGFVASIILFGCYNAGHAVTGDGGGGTGDGAQPPDAPGVMQVNVDAAPGHTCYGTDDGSTGVVRVCVPTPTPGITLNVATAVDTDASVQCLLTTTTQGTDVCVISSDMLSVGDTRVTGSRPLVIAGTTITIGGAIDISGHAGTSGAGAADCSGGAGAASTSNEPGGGAGGTFGGSGGHGGHTTTTSGGVPTPIVFGDHAFRGGCAGGAGGDAAGGGGGAGGHAGGAIAVLATQSITIIPGSNPVLGAIRARGEGGDGGGSNGNGGGGGGGASGGMIVLQAMSIALQATTSLEADGGGGGGGGRAGIVGLPGQDEVAADGVPATGGAGGGAGSGGVSSGSGDLTGSDGISTMTPADGAAGGGGGGAGVIRLFASSLSLMGSKINPPSR